MSTGSDEFRQAYKPCSQHSQRCPSCLHPTTITTRLSTAQSFLTVIMTNPPSQTRVPRSLSEGHNLNGDYPLLHNMHRTHSLPGTFPTTLPWGQRQRAMTGSTAIRPSPPQPCLSHHANLSVGGVPMQRSGRGREERTARPRGAPRAHTSAVVRPRLHAVLPIQLAYSFQHIPRTRRGQNNLTSNGGLETIEGDEELPAYSARAPRLSHIRWASPQVGGAAPPSYASTRGESMNPPGAPLLPSISRFGSHRHHPRINYSSEGNDNDDDLIRGGPLLTPARPTWSRSYTAMMRSGQALPAMTRFATGPLAR